MQHVEFFHREHFEYHYHRKKASKSLSRFIDYFWETDFDPLWQHHPKGFSDTLFPNVGYTYLINLGTPFTMQLEEQRHKVKSDAFLPRCKNMTCHHSAGNKIFGIKFKVSPVIFEKKINFYEYREYLFPLAYLIDPSVVKKIKKAPSFAKRVELISAYYEKIIEKYSGSYKQVDVVIQVLDEYYGKNNFSLSIEDLSHQHGISSRTLQRYFEATTSINCKQALQIIRIRKAIEQLTTDPAAFQYTSYGYYDYSHFYKHLKAFIHQHFILFVQPHRQLLHYCSKAKQ